MQGESLTALRRAWRCDCDGVSHTGIGGPPHGATLAMATMAKAIEERTGYTPPTCPWRAMYSPLVSAAIHIAEATDRHMLGAVTDEDTPAIWLDAALAYLRARETTAAKDQRDRHEAERKRRKG